MSMVAGDRLGPYEIVAPLGAGGMGEVYRARDTRLGRDVALKILPPEVANDSARRQRFELEARAVAALNHPNIVAVYDVGEGYMVGELVDGGSLRGAKLSLRKTLDVAAQIAGGLAAAHEAGIVHRDLKPDNVLLTRDGRAKVLDFGLAKMSAPHSHVAAATETLTVRTEPGTVMGTVGYMSPEQVRGEDLDHRSDIFNLGLVLHELLSGKRTFHSDTSVETLTAILKLDAPELPETVPVWVRQIVIRCLEKQPANRFQSAKDLAFALAQSAPSEAIQQPRAHGRLSALWAWQVIAGLALAVVVIFATHWLWRERPPAPLQGLLLADNGYFPRVSPDGQTLSFATLVGDSQELGIMKPESGDRAILTHERGRGFVWESAWSHDGTQIYFVRCSARLCSIYRIPVLGGEERLLLENAFGPAALPDGSLLVTRFTGANLAQLYRFWPDTGKVRDFPLSVIAANGSIYRAFPDGKHALAYGIPLPVSPGATANLYLVDLDSFSIRPFRVGPPPGRVRQIAFSRDGRTVLLTTQDGNLVRLMSIPASGNSPPTSLLTLTNEVNGLDVGPDGSIYLDQVERPQELLRFPASGGHVEKIADLTTVPGSGGGFAVLPDGRAVAPQVTAGRTRLMIYQPGKSPVPLVNTAEGTSVPVAVAGDQVAFLMWPLPTAARGIATASVAQGRITHQIPIEKNSYTGLALAPDGTTIYCAADDVVWAIPVAGGAPRKLRAGISVAIDPSGKVLVIGASEEGRLRLYRVPLDGGAEQMIPESADVRPSGLLQSGSLARDGRLVMPASSSFWWDPAAILDTRTGEAHRLTLDYVTDFKTLSWTPDGQIMALGMQLRSELWKFQPPAR
jgi:eukaryotic-like serine/threonine-protein kinase